MKDLSKEFRQAFKEDDQCFNFVQEEALDGIAYREISGDKGFWADPRFWRILAIKPRRVKHDLDFWHAQLKAEDRHREQIAFEECIANPAENAYDLVLPFHHNDGSLVWMELKGRIIESAKLGGKRMIIAFREITELKRQETFLRHSSEMARIGFYDWNIRAKKLEWSKVTKEIHAVADDFKPDYRQAIKFYKSGRSQQKITELVDRALHHGESFDEELQIVDGEGKEKWVRAIGIPEIKEGITIRLYGLFQDIDMQIRTQNAIRSERSLYRQVLEGASLGAWDWDIDADKMTLNHRAAQMLGYELEVMRREGQIYWFDLIHPNDKARLHKNLQNYLVGKSDKFEMECRLQRSNGKYRWLSITAKLFQPDLHFERPRLVGVWKDIHFEKQKMDYYSTFIQETPLAIAMFDKNMHYMDCSNKWRSDYGLEEIPIIGKSHYEIFPEISEEWKDFHQKCMEGGTFRRDEDSFIRPDGKLQWIRWEIRPWYNEDSELGGLIMYTEDINMRKEAQQKLAHSQMAFEANFTNGAIGMAIIGKDGEWLQVNDKICEMLAYTEAELKTKTFQEITHPDDLEKDLTELRKLEAGEIKNYQMEKRYFRKDGEILKATLAATSVRNKDNEVEYYISQIIDCRPKE
ncbi:MAG: PAS domain S-box protein [Bacteroidetes bacterium]|nr:PAS domain S-box protein [Bacteroidota bacterium]